MSPPLIETRGLSKHFGGVQAVRNIDFSLAEGELRCLIGPNGAGKSTFFKLLTGQIKPTSGAVLFRGTEITNLQASSMRFRCAAISGSPRPVIKRGKQSRKRWKRRSSDFRSAASPMV
jgi:ABC-type branched-subunit amino acid transport system ATPase component